MRVDEVMTRDVVYVVIDDDVEKCARMIMEHQISGLPVLDKGGKVVGMLTEGDLIRGAAHYEVPGVIEILGGLIYLDDPLRFMENLRRATALRAGRLMSRQVIAVNPGDSLEKAATEMVRHNFDRLPVINQDKRLEGIISRKDIMKVLFPLEEGDDEKEEKKMKKEIEGEKEPAETFNQS